MIGIRKALFLRKSGILITRMCLDVYKPDVIGVVLKEEKENILHANIAVIPFVKIINFPIIIVEKI